jgi:3-oxoacyl-[acyl-carrier protein] reductase
MIRLDGRVAVITGASRGIGAALARRAATAGAKIVFSYLSGIAEAEALAADINADRPATVAVAVQSDVRDPDDVQRLVGVAIDRFGRVDVAVSNAHKPYFPKAFVDTRWDEFQREIDTILCGAFNLAHACLPHMKAQGQGVIINVGSTMGLAPRTGHSFYATAKRALVGFTECLALELGPLGIRVNIVAPGPLQTPHNESFSAEQMAKLASETPLRHRLATVDEVADAILTLATDDARAVTGAHLLASGGFGIA